MKQVLKRILICISIIFLSISLVYNVFYTQILEEDLRAIKESQELIFQESNITFQYEEVIRCYENGRLMQYYTNINILIVSSIIGTIIGLCKSLKENSKVKYILYFIFGNITYNLLWVTVIAVILNNFEVLGLDYVSDYIYCYIEVSIKTLISYILIYATILIGNIIHNKKKVEELNRSLK